jgi:AhpD family alkylhydroperoxidase
MSQFGVHTKQTAPEQSVKLLEQAESAFGFVPNLLGVFAESPAVLKAYLQLGQIFDGSSFSPAERQVAILSVSRFNGCHYCMAAHSVIAGMQKVPEQAIEAIRISR